MEQNTRVAVDLGHLDPPPGMLLPLDEVMRLPTSQRVPVITGSQGEAAAALARIAADEYRKIKVGVGDVVIVSASPILGNEETVSRTIDNLFRRSANVVYTAVNQGVHVSGHGGRSELRRMLERRPKGEPQYGYLLKQMKETVGTILYRRSKSRPMILPVVTEL